MTTQTGPPRVLRVAPKRHWITRIGPRSLRATTLTVVLARPAVVTFHLLRVSPDCAAVGRFRIAGRRGINRVPFRGRLRGRVLPSGTYRVRAYVSGRAVAQTRVVIFERTPSPEEARAARGANACGGSGSEGAAADGSAGSSATASSGGTSGSLAPRVEPAAPAPQQDRAGTDAPSAGVLGARFTRAADAVRDVHPILFVLLGIAIALLGLAATPLRYVPNARIAALLAYRRSTVAIAGATTLVSVTLLYAFA